MECRHLKRREGVIVDPILIEVVVFLALTIVVVVAEGGEVRVTLLLVTLSELGEVVVVVGVFVDIRDVLLYLVVLVIAFDVGGVVQVAVLVGIMYGVFDVGIVVAEGRMVLLVGSLS